jgi:hypothetical protein
MNVREIAERVVDAWEKKARGETFLQERLHWKARGWLIDAITEAFSKAANAADGRGERRKAGGR